LSAAARARAAASAAAEAAARVRSSADWYLTAYSVDVVFG